MKESESQEGELTRLIQEYTRDKKYTVLEKEYIAVTDDGNYTEESIIIWNALAVSDGSHKSEHATSAMTI